MRIVNIDDLLSDVETDSAKLVVFYLSTVLASSINELSEQLSWSTDKTRQVCESLSEKRIVTELESSDTYALSRAVIR